MTAWHEACFIFFLAHVLQILQMYFSSSKETTPCTYLISNGQTGLCEIE